MPSLKKSQSASLGQFYKAASGDISISVSPATLGSTAAAATAGLTREVVCKVVDSDGVVQTWFSGTLPIASADVTAGDGSSAIEGTLTDVTITDGIGSVFITYSGTWAEGDTNTVTLGDTSSIMGYSVDDATSVDTIIA